MICIKVTIDINEVLNQVGIQLLEAAGKNLIFQA